MKQGQGLILSMRGELKLTPLLQMSIKVLQMSNQEMQSEIADALQENPLLELTEPVAAPNNNDASNGAQTTDFSQQEASTENNEIKWEDNIPANLSNDTNWDDVYTGGSATSASSSNNDWDPMTNRTSVETLQDHLIFELGLLPLSQRDIEIGEFIIDSIDNNGWLTQSIEEITEAINASHPKEVAIELDEVTAILHQIQSFEPTGVGATCLANCIALQLKAMDQSHPTVKRAIGAVEQHMDLISKQDFKKLAKRLQCSEGELELAIELIQMQNPYPGAIYGADDSEYITPDLIVKRDGSQWSVEVNPEITPKLAIHKDYSALIKSRDSSGDNQYLKDKLQGAQWLIQSVENRFDTLIKVGAAIVERQVDFFERGAEAMKPMIQADIAQMLDFSESTISRAIDGKYMLTPQGVIELKYFFSSHLATNSGDTSSTAVRAIIKKLVSEEPPHKPLSDAKLTKALEEQGIEVARRTVAKYRESLGIESSSKRKRLK